MSSLDQKRNGREYAEEVARLAKRAPDDETRAKVYAAANFARRLYGFTDKEKAEDVLHFINLGAATVDDLMKETGLRRQDVQEIITNLHASHKVRIQTLNGDRPGPPRKLITPIDPSKL